MKKELKSGILSADKSADHRTINRTTVGRPSAGLMLSWFYYPCSENKGADLADYREADLRLCFRIC